MNAILQCAKFGVPTAGADIYVTHFPCLQCCKAIVQAGIKTVYYELDYKNHPYALELFEQANIETVQVERKELENKEEKKALVEALVKQLKENNADSVEIEALEKERQNYSPLYQPQRRLFNKTSLLPVYSCLVRSDL